MTNNKNRGILKSRIESGELPLKVRTQKQNAHIKNTREYVEGNSYLTVDTKEIQTIIDTKHLTGKVYVINDGKHIKERIECDKIIGVDVDKEKGIEETTSRATIHYSKSGTHLVPTHAKEKKHD